MRKQLIACVALGIAFLSVDLPAAAQDPGLIDLYFSDWHGVARRAVRGSLELQEIFVRGNPQSPAHKGEVVRFINSCAYATLAPNTSTESARLDGQQEVYFVASGHGKVTKQSAYDSMFASGYDPCGCALFHSGGHTSAASWQRQGDRAARVLLMPRTECSDAETRLNTTMDTNRESYDHAGRPDSRRRSSDGG